MLVAFTATPAASFRECRHRLLARLGIFPKWWSTTKSNLLAVGAGQGQGYSALVAATR